MLSETSVILGFPKNVGAPFDWSTLARPQFVTQTYDDLVELFEQLEFQRPSDVIIQADSGLVHALKLCRVIIQLSQVRVHLVSQHVTTQQAVAARSIGVSSIYDVDAGYDALAELIADHAERKAIRRGSRLITAGTLTIDVARRRAEVGSTLLSLTKTEFDILVLLAGRPREIMSRKDVTRHVWGEGWYGAANVLDTHLTHLRAKLLGAGHKDAIVTVYRSGFYFEPQLDANGYVDAEMLSYG
jgi:DNA-binding response OmpR family regulator